MKILPFILFAILCGCSQVQQDNAQEIRQKPPPAKQKIINPIYKDPRLPDPNIKDDRELQREIFKRGIVV